MHGRGLVMGPVPGGGPWLAAASRGGRRSSVTSGGPLLPWSWFGPLLAAATMSLTPATAASSNNTIQGVMGSCCALANASCRDNCHKVPLWELAGDDREQHLLNFRATCPSTLVDFWSCLNHTLEGVSEGQGWMGRPCCSLGVAPGCQWACLTAKQPQDLTPHCRHSHEMDLFTCVHRNQVGSGCCSQTQSYRCRATCEAVFADRTPNRRLRKQLSRDCRSHPKVSRCAHTFTKTSPSHKPEKNLHCCGTSADAECRAACRSVLTSDQHQQDILDTLEDACGMLDLTKELWKCLLRHSDSNGSNSNSESHQVRLGAHHAPLPEYIQVSALGRLGLDAAKLSCCDRATSSECRGLCVRAFTNEWGRAWDTLNSACILTPQESRLAACLAEAEAPCSLGCSSLSFCTNFNNRPAEMFRSCNARADAAAEQDLNLWQENSRLSLPGLASSVPIKSVLSCQQEVWKAVACTLHIQPCHQQTLTNAICWHDCVNLLSRCMLQAPGEGVTAGGVCRSLSPAPGAPCVSLEGFLVPSTTLRELPWREPSLPCRDQPCPPTHICTVNHNCRADLPCLPYICTPSCALGEVSSVAVPSGSFVALQISSGRPGCGQVCQCDAEGGELESCQPLPCLDPAPCWIKSTRIEHSRSVLVGCRTCVCHAGELNCIPRLQCLQHPLHLPLPRTLSLTKGVVSSHGSLIAEDSINNGARMTATSTTHCGCPTTWTDPVCTINGRTLPSPCVARCLGFLPSSWSPGECGTAMGVCEGQCRAGQTCVLTPNSCLAPPIKHCSQYTCVPLSGPCPSSMSHPACDIRGHEHQTLCSLVRQQQQLAYLGPCRVGCSPVGEVCGLDGRTWPSECAAHAQYVLVDHLGACRGHDQDTCDTVICPRNTHHTQSCVGVSSTHWCCGRVCGGGLVAALSRRALEVAAVALKPMDIYTLTTKALLHAIQGQVQVSECQVWGHMTPEGHLLVLVTPSATSSLTPPPPQVSAACVAEAERLAGQVHARSPRLLATVPAHALIIATTVHSTSSWSGVVLCPSPLLLLTIATLLVYYCHS